MLAYVKTILLKVSFDQGIFEKELHKGLRALGEEEAQELEEWCYTAFYSQHPLVLTKAFAEVQEYQLSY